MRAWESAQRLHPLDRGTAILATALPDRTPDVLDALPLGDRQSLLFRLRELTFGPHLEGVADCSSCGEPLEFELDLAAVADASEVAPGGEVEIALDGYDLRLRPLCFEDVRVAATYTDPLAARRCLAERSVVLASRDEVTVPSRDLPDSLIDGIGAALAEIDGGAEVLLELVCPACQAKVTPVLDGAEILWAEVRAQALRLLREVHTLASAYGWSEGDILSMSGARRASYLALVEE